MKESIDSLNLKKSKYTIKELTAILKDQERVYEKKIDLERKRNEKLSEENRKLILEINEIKNNNIIKEQSEEKESLHYFLLVQKLNDFSKNWIGYFDYIKTKYPYYPIIKKTEDLKDKISILLNGEQNEEFIDKLVKELSILEQNSGYNSKKQQTNEQSKNAESEFDINDILNPGELHLEDLCKELGLIN